MGHGRPQHIPTPDEPERWGLPAELVADLGDRLRRFWQRYAAGFRTQTRDGSEDAYHDLSGLLRMPHKRMCTHSGRQTGVAGQNLQRCVSNSPWSAQDVIAQVQAESAAMPGLERGGMLLRDESADIQAGDTSAARTPGSDEGGMGRYMMHMRSGGHGTRARRGHRQNTSKRSPLRQAPPEWSATRRFVTAAAAELCGLS